MKFKLKKTKINLINNLLLLFIIRKFRKLHCQEKKIIHKQKKHFKETDQV